MVNLGFSTGALAKGNFELALKQLAGRSLSAVELSALRADELPRLVESVNSLNLDSYSYISVHAPSSFGANDELWIIDLLRHFPKRWKIILHPDTINDVSRWSRFGNQLALENMDSRKTDGRTFLELARWFKRLPEAQLCVDLAHAHQLDSTMTEAYIMLTQFNERICQVHLSELDSDSRHYPLSQGTVRAFSEVADLIPKNAAVIIESRVTADGIDSEISKAREIFEVSAALAHS